MWCRPMSRIEGRYSRLHRRLHWATALTLPAQGLLGWLSERVDDALLGKALMAAHLQLGVVLLVLLALRLTVRFWRPTPPPPLGDPRWQQRIAAVVHATLYALMVLLPLSGLVLWAWMRTPLDLFGLLHVAPVLSTRPDDETSLVIGWYLHVWGAWALAGVAALHVGAALWHQWIVRDRRILDRM